jgi:hypothetical protein
VQVPSREVTVPQVFISYSHDDRSLFCDLLEHLAPLETALRITFWHDERLQSGHEWHESIGREIRVSQSFILLLSPKYLASPYIRSEELPRIHERRESDRNVVMLPVIIQKCLWKPFFPQLILPVPLDARRRPQAIRDWRPQRDGYYEASLQIANSLGAWLGVNSTQIA